MAKARFADIGLTETFFPHFERDLFDGRVINLLRFPLWHTKRDTYFSKTNEAGFRSPTHLQPLTR